MNTFYYTPDGRNVSHQEDSAVKEAVVTSTPVGWRYDGYRRFAHGATANHRTWFASYTNGRQGRSRRSKEIAVLQVIPQ